MCKLHDNSAFFDHITSWSFKNWYHAAIEINMPLSFSIQIHLNALEFNTSCNQSVVGSFCKGANVVVVQAQMICVELRLRDRATTIE
jgi:hypothetical protein